jgi:hypothetical protein
MEGPFQLTERVIDTIVTGTAPAIFLIRRIEETPKYAHYRGRIGRATESDLKQELKRWLDSDYRVFCFDYVDSPDTAFEQQCRLWHELGGPEGKLVNEQHPRPDNDTGRCPVCSIP